MIPIRLSLTNFLSYGESVDPLDFTSFKLACLSGKNGHGKSALLDAMTWAVWGEARKADFNRTPDADLLRLSTDEMAVQFTFDLNGYQYTVDRGFKRGKRQGKSTLEFSVRENPEDPARILTGSSKRETQARIIETVGLDYRTFINSSFLKQGKSDEFTRQTPQDRKDLLANILGLSYYDQLLEETKSQLKDMKAEEKHKKEQIESLEKELEEEEPTRLQETELKEELAHQNESLAAVQEQEIKMQEQLNRLRLEKEKVEGWKREEQSLQTQTQESQTRLQENTQELEEIALLIDRKTEIESNFKRYEEISRTLKRFLEIETRCKTLEDQKKQLEQRVSEHLHSLREQLAGLQSESKQIQTALLDCSAWLAKEAEITQQYRAYEQLLQQEKSLSEKQSRYNALQQELQQIENRIEQEKQKRFNRAAELRGQTLSLPKKQEELNALQEKRQALPGLEQQREQRQSALQQLEEKGLEARNRITQCEEKTKQLKTALKETQEFAELIEKGDTETCPVCKQSLSEHARGDLQQHYRQDIQRMKEEIQAYQKQGKDAAQERETIGDHYKSKRVELDALQKQIAALQHEREILPQKKKEIEQLSRDLQEMKWIEEEIQNNRFALDERKKREAHLQSLQQLGYDPEQHGAVQKQLHAQRQTEADWRTLQEKKSQQQSLQERAKQVEQETAAIRKTIETQAFCGQERQDIAALEQQIKPLLKELEQRKALHEEQDRLRSAPAEHQQLLHAEKRKPTVEKEIQDTQKKLTELTGQRERLQKQLRDADSLLKHFDEQTAAHQKIVEERKTIEHARNQTYQAIGAVQARLEGLQKKKKETETLRNTLQTIAKEMRYLEILRKAFSRDGIPALMVEQALPELEEDANNLLRRLTHGACTVRFQTQRESKSGVLKETLDILISDEMGTRDYDLFSGGEAFRTDLAVRIALSQLLCRRAGSRLQLLVIDEGFGTQDAEGLSNIVDAIDEIQDEFEKVLIVTHIEELKDRFKDRIEVVKDPGIGSRFQVVHAV